jgi:hypothetical protein
MDMSMPDISIVASAVGGWLLAPAAPAIEVGTGAYAGHSIKPTESPGPNIGMKPTGISERSSRPGNSRTAQ